MFDNFVASLKSQTSQLGSSFSDLRSRLSPSGNNSVKRSNTVNGYFGSSDVNGHFSLPKSGSDYSIANTDKQQVKLPSLLNNKKPWFSTSLDHSKAIPNHTEATDMETETVFRNPTLIEDEQEPCLIVKFDRALASMQSIEKV